MRERLISLLLAAVTVFGLLPILSDEVTAGEEMLKPIWPTAYAHKINGLDTYYNGGSHNGIDILPDDSGDKYIYQDIVAIADGVVTVVRKNGCSHENSGKGHKGKNCSDGCPDTWGNYVCIEHTVNGETYYSIYAHLKYGSATVEEGDEVAAGEVIGKMGSSGGSTAHHLHLEIWEGEYSDRASKHARSIEFYLNNLTELAGARFHKGLATYSKLYKSWIKENCELDGDYYVYNSYFADCKGIYPSYGEATIKAACNPYPLPCSNATAEKYGYSSLAMTEKTLSPGDQVTINGIVQNSEGNFWYEVTLPDGTDNVYILSEKAGEMTRKWPYVEGSIVDDSISGSTLLDGSVIAGGCLIGSVQAFVYSGTAVCGQAVIQSDLDAVSTTVSYALKRSDVDYSLPFKKLDDYGDAKYTLAIEVAVTNYMLDQNYQLVVPSEQEYVIAGSDYFSYDEDDGCSHSYKTAVTAPTCVEWGYTTYTCKSCGYDYTSNYTDPQGHSYGDWETILAGTCTTDAVEARSCTVCGDEQTQNVAAPGHLYEQTAIAATCQTYAHTQYVCTACQHSYIEYSENEYSEWSETKPADVDESLIQSRDEYRYQCKEYTSGTDSTMDGWTLYNTTLEWGEYGDWSDWSDTAVASGDATKVETRTVYGYYYYLCSKCGAHMHGYGTCYTWAGGCGAKTTSSDFHEVWSTVTWKEAGLKEWHGTGKYYAYIDGELLFKWSKGDAKTQYRYATRGQETVYRFYRWSDWSQWMPGEMASDESANVETRTVYRYLQRQLVEHRYESCVTAPTCTEQGYTTHTCANCNRSYADSYVDATGHSYGYAVTEEPSRTAPGVLTGSCADCSDAVTETLPALNTADYTYTVVKEPSTTETGIGRYTWNNTAFGTYCFEVALAWMEGDYAPGDVNGDGGLNNKDLTRLFQYLSGWDVEVSEIALDINGDGSLNNKDLTRLFQYLSGWDVDIH